MNESIEPMTRRPLLARTLAPLRQIVAGYRAAGETVALVPTMGALHDGHVALVRAARQKAGRTVVSIFVNPAQFGAGEDFSTYPRPFEADLATLTALNVDLVWSPSLEAMYPAGFETKVVPGGVATVGLEDAFRPHFFSGVATVVTKLLLQCLPDFAMFGEKDYQQLCVVTQTARELDIPVKIIGVPTVREPDGLALSSRNVYLSTDERAIAPALYRALTRCADIIAQGQPIASTLADGRRTIEQTGFKLDYLEARHAETLRPAASLADGPIRLLAAAKIGATRLIDNVAVKAAPTL